jgi:hypothetical protein
MEKAHFTIKMDLHIKDNGKMTNNMEWVKYIKEKVRLVLTGKA